jgi:hypothetical protein
VLVLRININWSISEVWLVLEFVAILAVEDKEGALYSMSLRRGAVFLLM